MISLFNSIVLTSFVGLSMTIIMFFCGFYYYKYFCVNRDFEKAVKKFRKNGLNKGILVFGSARIPDNDPHMAEIEEISKFCAQRIIDKDKKISFISGGGPSVMYHWLKPAYELGLQTAGFGIKLPFEEKQNFATTEKYSYTFKQFTARKKTMFKYARAFVIFKGGYGTLDELMEVLTLMNTKKMKPVPVLVYPASFYKDVLNFSNFLEAGTISKDDYKLLTVCKTKEEMLTELYKVIDIA